MKTVEVVCGLAIRNGMVLMGKRLPSSLRPDLWEYPGGKVEPGESPQEALVRELQEELGVTVTVGDFIGQNQIDFEVRARLSLFAVTFEGEPQALTSHSALTWVSPGYAVRSMPLAPSAYLSYQEVLAYMARAAL
jgi:mutator protein MutT